MFSVDVFSSLIPSIILYITLTTSSIACAIFCISFVMFSVAPAVCVAILDISEATTENPLPASPALAASILALRASNSVCDAISSIIDIIECISVIWLLRLESLSATSLPFLTDMSTVSTSCSISALPCERISRVFDILSEISLEASSTRVTF